MATGSHGDPFVHPRVGQGGRGHLGTYGVGRVRGRDRVPDGLPGTVTVPDGPLKFPNLVVSLTHHGFGHGHVPEG